MEKKRKSKIHKWNEVGGVLDSEVDEAFRDFDEEAGSGPSISKNPMRSIEDMVEQNDNNIDGVINNLPNPKPVSQIASGDVVEEDQIKESILGRIRESTPNQYSVKPKTLCSQDLERG